MKATCLLLLAGASVFISVSESKSQSENQVCWEMSAPMKELTPFVLILLNKCTGGSWILTRTTTSAPTSTSSGNFSYRWVALEGGGSQAGSSDR
jgi:hypothetical protein